MLTELDLSNKALRKYGVTMAVCLFWVGLILFLKHKPLCKPFWIISAFFLAAGLCIPIALRPVYSLWMRLAFCLGWLNTRVILTLLYYLVVTPIGLCARLFGKNFLDVRLDKEAQSYWCKREAADFPKQWYERIF